MMKMGWEMMHISDHMRLIENVIMYGCDGILYRKNWSRSSTRIRIYHGELLRDYLYEVLRCACNL